MATTRFSGKNLLVEWKKTGGTLVTLTADGRAFDFTHEMQTADATAGADDYRVMLPTVKSASATMEMVMNGTAPWLAQLALGDTGELTWYPEGKVIGKPVWSMAGVVTKMSQSLPYDDVAKYSLEFQNNGSSLLKAGIPHA